MDRCSKFKRYSKNYYDFKPTFFTTTIFFYYGPTPYDTFRFPDECYPTKASIIYKDKIIYMNSSYKGFSFSACASTFISGNVAPIKISIDNPKIVSIDKDDCKILPRFKGECMITISNKYGSNTSKIIVYDKPSDIQKITN